MLKHLGDAVDKARQREHRELSADDDHRLTKTKCLWLTHPIDWKGQRDAGFSPLALVALY